MIPAHAAMRRKVQVDLPEDPEAFFPEDDGTGPFRIVSRDALSERTEGSELEFAELFFWFIEYLLSICPVMKKHVL